MVLSADSAGSNDPIPSLLPVTPATPPPPAPPPAQAQAPPATTTAPAAPGGGAAAPPHPRGRIIKLTGGVRPAGTVTTAFLAASRQGTIVAPNQYGLSLEQMDPAFTSYSKIMQYHSQENYPIPVDVNIIQRALKSFIYYEDRADFQEVLGRGFPFGTINVSLVPYAHTRLESTLRLAWEIIEDNFEDAEGQIAAALAEAGLNIEGSYFSESRDSRVNTYTADRASFILGLGMKGLLSVDCGEGRPPSTIQNVPHAAHVADPVLTKIYLYTPARLTSDFALEVVRGAVPNRYPSQDVLSVDFITDVDTGAVSLNGFILVRGHDLAEYLCSPSASKAYRGRMVVKPAINKRSKPTKRNRDQM